MYRAISSVLLSEISMIKHLYQYTLLLLLMIASSTLAAEKYTVELEMKEGELIPRVLNVFFLRYMGIGKEQEGVSQADPSIQL